ncbi:MAG: bifunctional glycosyltransferase/class I SAM-dependent methyltransferase [Candidatus Daviesbacteria bacterium]
MWDKKTVSVIFPTYREKKSIRRTIQEFDSTGYIDEIIVVDNNAEKGTREEVEKTRAKLIYEPRQGFGRAIRSGISSTKADIFIIAEPDGTFKGKDIIKLLAYLDDFEIVFGSRTHQPLIHQNSKMTFSRRFFDVLLGKFISYLFLCPPLTDVGCIFRITSRKGWKKVMNECQSDGAMFATQWQLVAAKNKVRFIEIPVNFRKRVGISSITATFSDQARWAFLIFLYILKVWVFNFLDKKRHSKPKEVKYYKGIICPICQNPDIEILNSLPTHYFCSYCKTAWKIHKQNTVYETTYYQGQSKIASKLFNLLMKRFYKKRLSYVKNVKRNSWIDVGAGEGSFLQVIPSKIKIGVEVSTSGTEMMKHVNLKTISDQQFLKTGSLNVDIISFWHSLEHIQNPDQYLEASYNHLKKHGKIIIGLPNIDSLEFSFLKNKWFHLAPYHHIWQFSPNSIKKLLIKHNLKIEKIDYFSFEHHFAGLLQSIINISSGTENVLHSLVRREIPLTIINLKTGVWIIFWLTLGLPFVVIFWFFAALVHKSGTFVVIANKEK